MNGAREHGDDDLVAAVRERVRGQNPPTPLELATRAAAQDDPALRARTLVDLVGRLRAHGCDELALRAALTALRTVGTEDVVRAAQIHVLAIHGAAGRLEEAEALGESLLAEGHEPSLVRAMAHVYWERFVRTEDTSYRERWRELSSLVPRAA